MKDTATLPFILALFLCSNLPGQAVGMDMSNMDMASSAHAQTVENQAVGIVDEINAAKGTVTISHEAIKSLGWPAMTMDFIVQDKKMLGKIAKSQRIHFTFVQHGDDYLITNIQ